MYESPSESSKSLVSLNAPTELNPYGRATVNPPLAPTDSRAHSRCAASLAARRRTYSPIPSHRDNPPRRVSRITVLTPSRNVARPSGPTSHVRRTPSGRPRRQKPLAGSTGGPTGSTSTSDIAHPTIRLRPSNDHLATRPRHASLGAISRVS